MLFGTSIGEWIGIEPRVRGYGGLRGAVWRQYRLDCSILIISFGLIEMHVWRTMNGDVVVLYYIVLYVRTYICTAQYSTVQYSTENVYPLRMSE